MRVFSTNASSKSGEASWVSIIETAVSIAAFFLLVPKANWPILLAVASVALLRTEASEDRGIRWSAWVWSSIAYSALIFLKVGTKAFSALFASAGGTKQLASILGAQGTGVVASVWNILLGLALLPVALALIVTLYVLGSTLLVAHSILVGGTVLVLGVLIRFTSSVVEFFSSPILLIKSFPTNWHRVVFATAVTTLPEIVPGAETRRDVFLPRFSNLTQSTAEKVFAGRDSRIWLPLDIVNRLPILLSFTVYLPCYIPGILCRICLKATSFLWWPIIFLTRRTVETQASWSVVVWDFAKSAKSQLVRVVSWVVVFAFLFKVLVIPNAVVWWSASSLSKWMDPLLTPKQIHVWHVAAFVKASSYLIIYFYIADRAEKFVVDGVWNADKIKNGILTYLSIRNIISVYTMLATFIVVIEVAQLLKLPEFVGVLFPAWPLE